MVHLCGHLGALLSWLRQYSKRHCSSECSEQLASARGHIPVRLEVKPTFGNTFLWRSIYEFDGRFYVDAIRTAFGAIRVTGSSIEKLDVNKQFPG